MRKFTIAMATACFMISLPYGEANAQKFLKKLSNAIDKGIEAVDKATDDLLGISKKTLVKPVTTINEDGVEITTFNQGVTFDPVSCIRYENSLKIEYTVFNAGQQLTVYGLGTPNPADSSYETYIEDDLGNTYPVSFLAMEEVYSKTEKGTINFNLLPEVVLNGSIHVRNIDPAATALSVVNIAGFVTNGEDEKETFEFTFKNISITGIENEFAEEDVVHKKQIKRDGCYKDVWLTITGEITKLAFRRDINCPQKPEEDVNITVGGLIHEPINSVTIRNAPNLVDCIYIFNYDFSSDTEELIVCIGGTPMDVPLVEPEGVDIAGTTGVMTLQSSYNSYDNRTRLTAAERAELKVDRIKHPEFDTSWKNAELSKGKTIYEGKQGKLQTILFHNPDTYTGEWLISYDSSGNIIDCIQIASLHVWGGDRGQGVFEGDKIAVSFEYPEGGTYIDYTITPDLKFRKDKERSEEF